MSDENDNEIVQQTLARLVVEEITDLPFEKANANIGPLVTNYFSFIFSIEAHTSRGTQKVFVKIPKEDLRKGSRSILPISTADQRMAEDEVCSLRMLAEQWRTEDLGVRWVTFRGVVENYNAIVTDRVMADAAFAVFRRWDLRRRMGLRRDARRLRHAMRRLGEALGRFHQSQAQPAVFDVTAEMPKFERYCQELATCTRSPWPARVLDTIRSLGCRKFSGIMVPTLKGIDIRNVLIDAQDRLTLLDPGKFKIKFREADLARFVMTYRILYWGSGLLLLARQPDPKAEAEFLDAYYAHSQPASRQLLSLYIIKEQLKHWHTALASLSRLPWAPVVKTWVTRIYVNPFYNCQLSYELERLKTLETQ